MSGSSTAQSLINKSVQQSDVKSSNSEPEGNKEDKSTIVKKQYNHASPVKRDRIVKRSPSTSIYQTQKKLEKKTEQKLQEEDFSNKPSTSFTFDELMKFWLQYAELLKQKGKGGMHSTLNKYEPKLNTETFIVSFDLDSELQKIEFQQQSQDFLSFLRKNLDNYSIKIQLNVLAMDQGVKVHLNSKDKFIKMAEKNPDLNLLRDKFNLDIEY